MNITDCRTNSGGFFSKLCSTPPYRVNGIVPAFTFISRHLHSLTLKQFTCFSCNCSLPLQSRLDIPSLQIQLSLSTKHRSYVSLLAHKILWMYSKGGDEIERELADLRVVFKILRNKFPLVLIIAYTTAWLSGIITIYLIPDTYKAKTELIIYNPDAPPSYLEENSAVFGTWRAMIKSVYMTNLVKKKLGPSIQTKESGHKKF